MSAFTKALDELEAQTFRDQTLNSVDDYYRLKRECRRLIKAARMMQEQLKQYHSLPDGEYFHEADIFRDLGDDAGFCLADVDKLFESSEG